MASYGFFHAFLLIAFSSLVVAGPVDVKDAAFYFHIDDEDIYYGEWRLYIISVGEFESDGWEFSGYYDDIKSQYIDFKNQCGMDNVFFEEIYEMSQEERQHKGCVINGTYQERYCFRTATTNPSCQPLIPYKIDENQDRLSFDAYYDSYMWDIGRSGFYHHYDVHYCDIVDGNCRITLNALRNPINPYVAVLEKLNSSEIYFSGEIVSSAANIFSNKEAFECPADDIDGICEIHREVVLAVTDFEKINPNGLNINLSMLHRNNIYKDGDLWKSMGYYKLMAVFVFLMLVSLALSFWTVIKMRDRTLKSILRKKNRFQKDMIRRTYYAIFIPLMTFALFGIFIWILSQLLRP